MVGTGKCTCDNGYRGADCSLAVTTLTNGMSLTIPFEGTRTFYMQYDAGVFVDNDWELTLSNLNPFSVYLSAGLAVDPTENVNDIEVKEQTYIKLSSKAFPSLKSSFVIHAHIQGINFGENNLLSNNLMVTFNRLPGPSGFLHSEMAL